MLHEIITFGMILVVLLTGVGVGFWMGWMVKKSERAKRRTGETGIQTLHELNLRLGKTLESQSGLEGWNGNEPIIL
jgi:NhaP-type Na+/H+ or K+/H+ antiporter